MYCRIRENFTTDTTTIDDVKSQGDKEIMLADKYGNISLVKFSDTVMKLQDMITALNNTVIKLQGDLGTANNEISNLKKQTLRVPLLNDDPDDPDNKYTVSFTTRHKREDNTIEETTHALTKGNIDALQMLNKSIYSPAHQDFRSITGRHNPWSSPTVYVEGNFAAGAIGFGRLNATGAGGDGDKVHYVKSIDSDGTEMSTENP
jgi:hypothetical protein